jgi:polar amino acid transport system substrate-binding protein
MSSITKQTSTALVAGALLIMGWASSATAETVLAKVARTGVLTLGVNTDRVPYAYFETDGAPPVGYSIDMANLVKDTLESYLDEEITLEMVEVGSFGERVALLDGGQIDLSCDVVFTWERDQVVDYSDSYSISGMRLVTLANSTLDAESDLANARVGITAEPLASSILGAFYPEATPVIIDTYDAGFDALESGEIDALGGDSILLAGFAQPRGSENYQLIPDAPITNFGVSCIVPENNSTFLGLVNYSIASFMDGYVTGEPTAVAIIDRWFGDNGVVPLGEERLAIAETFFRFQLLNRAQVPPEGIDFNALGGN